MSQLEGQTTPQPKTEETPSTQVKIESPTDLNNFNLKMKDYWIPILTSGLPEPSQVSADDYQQLQARYEVITDENHVLYRERDALQRELQELQERYNDLRFRNRNMRKLACRLDNITNGHHFVTTSSIRPLIVRMRLVCAMPGEEPEEDNVEHEFWPPFQPEPPALLAIKQEPSDACEEPAPPPSRRSKRAHSGNSKFGEAHPPKSSKKMLPEVRNTRACVEFHAGTSGISYIKTEMEMSSSQELGGNETGAGVVVKKRRQVVYDANGKAKFSCAICSKAYGTRRSLFFHQKNAHSSGPLARRSMSGSSLEMSQKTVQPLAAVPSSPPSPSIPPALAPKAKKAYKPKARKTKRRKAPATKPKPMGSKAPAAGSKQEPEHGDDSTPTQVKCKCGRLFNRDINLIEHLRLKIGERVFKCDLCTADFARFDYFKDHRMKVHQEATEGMGCRECGARGFMTHKSLREHRDAVHPRTPGATMKDPLLLQIKEEEPDDEPNEPTDNFEDNFFGGEENGDNTAMWQVPD